MTKTQPTHKKLPMARVLCAAPDRMIMCRSIDKSNGRTQWYACIPAHTPAQAKQIVKAAEFLRLPEEEKVERIRRHFAQNWTGSYEEDARSVLAAMGMGGAK